MELQVGSNYKRTLGFKNILARLVWNISHAILFRFFISSILNGWRISLLRVFGAKIGRGCSISNSAKIWAPWNLEMGNDSCLGPEVFCYNTGKVIIGNGVVISHGAYLCPGSHDMSDPNFPMIPSTIVIKDNAWIATEAFIGPKVTIGEGAIVGARGCVFKDVDPWSVVGGNPATFIKKRIIKEIS
ncbi:MAG: putative colanic acid biosynthesis acetyltransferase [Bacteroidales bacterium]